MAKFIELTVKNNHGPDETGYANKDTEQDWNNGEAFLLTLATKLRG